MNIKDNFVNIVFNHKIVAKNKITIDLANNIRNRNNNIAIESLSKINHEFITGNIIESKTAYVAPTYRTNALCFIKDMLDNETDTILLYEK